MCNAVFFLTLVATCGANFSPQERPFEKRGNLRFTAPVLNSTGVTFPGGIASGDFDNDRIPEIVTADSFNGTVSILQYQGQGRLRVISSPNVGTGEASDVVVGEVTGDGLPDLVVAKRFGRGSFAVLPGTGDLRFGAPRFFGDDDQASTQIELADLDLDGDLDVVLAAPLLGVGDPQAVIFLNQANATFAAPIAYPLASNVPFTYTSLVALGDVNGDGLPDIVGTSSPLVTNAGLLLGVGNGIFSSAPPIDMGGGSLLGLAIGDCDGDGDNDVMAYQGALGSPAVRVARNDGAGNFSRPLAIEVTGAIGFEDKPRALLLGSLGPNRVLDLVTSGSIIDGATGSTIPSGLLSFDGTLADLDGDGRLDIILASRDSSFLGIAAVLLNRTPTRVVLSGRTPIRLR